MIETRGRDQINGRLTIVMSAEDRFWLRVDKTDGCWIWTGTDNGQGYGIFWPVRTLPVKAHRFAYEQLVGPIPAGLTLDHLCRNRRCVNPAHLEPVPSGVNAMRGMGPSALNSRKTHCKHGHQFTAENTVMESGSRRCRTCKAAKLRAAYWRNPESERARSRARYWSEGGAK